MTAAAPAKPAAPWEDLVDVFTQPAAVFARRRDGRFWLALVVFSLLGAASAFAARPVLRPAFDRQMSVQIEKIQANPQIPAEQKAAIAARMRGAADSPFAVAAAAGGFPVLALATAVTLWLVAKGFGSGATFAQALAVTAIGGIPRVVLGLAVASVSAIMGRQVETVQGITAGPAALLGADASPLLASVLGRLDAGVVWHTILLGVGIGLMGRVVRRGDAREVQGMIGRGRGLAAAAVVWAIATALAVWQGVAAG